MGENFVVYKASGGLAHSLGGLWRAIGIARGSNRFLIIDYNVHKAFLNPFSKFFHLDIDIPYSDNYRVIPRNYTYRGHTVEELKNEELGENYRIYGESAKHNKKGDKIIVVAGTSGKRGWVSIDELRVNNDILERLKSEPQINERYIAVHFRNTDIKSNLGRQVSQINQIRKATKINTLYLSSDDYDAFNKYKKVLPDMKIIMLAKPPKVEWNIHYDSVDKSKQIYECLRDCYFILKSDFFVPCTTSGLSRMLIMMLEKNKNMFCIPTKSIPATGYKNKTFEELFLNYLNKNKEFLAKEFLAKASNQNKPPIRSPSPIKTPLPIVKSSSIITPSSIKTSQPAQLRSPSPEIKSSLVRTPSPIKNNNTISNVPQIKSNHSVSTVKPVQTLKNDNLNEKDKNEQNSNLQNNKQNIFKKRSSSPLKLELSEEDYIKINKVLNNLNKNSLSPM